MKNNKWRLITGIFLGVILIFSIGFSIYKIITTGKNVSEQELGVHLKSDYVLMLIQCCLGLVVMGLPSALEKKFSLAIPNSMSILYFVFLFCAIYLGEVRNFYYLIPCWDDILHCFSGAMLGAFGFTLVSILNDSEKIHVVLSPVFISLFAFCFALAGGAIWEIYEFSGDFLLGLNMQKHTMADGTMLVGIEALSDTMHDLIIDAAGALGVAIMGFIQMKSKEYYKKHKK